jgi:hypothetical protein
MVLYEGTEYGNLIQPVAGADQARWRSSGSTALTLEKKMKTKELERILNESDGERSLCAFLSSNPFVLIESLEYFGSPARVIKEFPLGSEYKADFAVIAPFSGGFEIKHIEVEPPSSGFFNKDGSLSARANKALEQVNSWKTYIEKNRQQYLRDLDRLGQEKDLIKEHTEPMTCLSGWRIHHPRISIFDTYTILMGRRETLDEKGMERKAQFRKNNKVSIVSTDRLFIGTVKIDDNPEVYL